MRRSAEQVENTALEPLSMRRLLDLAVEEMRRNFRAIYLWAAAPMAVGGLFVGLAQMRWFETLSSLGAEGSVDGMLSGALFWGVGVLVAATLYMICYVAVMVAAMDALEGRQVEMVRAWRIALRPRIFLTALTVSLLVLVSTLACVFPAFYVGPLLCLALPAALEEKLTTFEAIGRSVELGRFNPSRQLSRSPWLRGLLIYVVWTLISNALSMVVQVPIQVVQQFLMLREGLEGEIAEPLVLMGASAWLQVPATVLGALVAVVGFLYLTFAIGLLYHETRRLKEGADLELAIANLTQPPSAVPSTQGP